MRTAIRGLALALSWLTVLPVRTGAPDAPTAGAALRWAPIVGALLGGAAGGLLLGLARLGVPPLVAGLLTVGFLGLATRGLHLDGLADTADGLGCYGPPERALAVMRDGGTGPFAVVTLVVALGAQAASLAALPPERAPVLVALAAAASRASFAWVARRGVPAARPGGLGATVAGSQPWWVAPLWWITLGAAGFAAAGARGALAVGFGAVLVVALSRHTARRFAGMTGDVLGAASELAFTTALLVTGSTTAR